MARRNRAEMMRQQKEAKQKKLLIVLIPLFLGLVAWQGPKMHKAFLGPPPEATPPPAATTTAPADPAATPPSTQTETTGATPAAGLVDTDVPPASATDRLVSFSRFASRDPFGEPGGAGQSGASPPPDTGGDEAASSAVVAVNGTSETVSVGGSFPAGDPTFRLVSVSPDKAVIGLVSGSFAGGQNTVELAVGEQLELVADPDGTLYTFALVSIG
jgi:hypothetical protein